MQNIEDLRAFHAQHARHLHLTELDFKRLASMPPPKLRAGSKQLEIQVRHFSGEEEWQPLDIPHGRKSNSYDA
jgi:hypothetical protein